jgi:hypothetical protein
MYKEKSDSITGLIITKRDSKLANKQGYKKHLFLVNNYRQVINDFAILTSKNTSAHPIVEFKLTEGTDKLV